MIVPDGVLRLDAGLLDMTVESRVAEGGETADEGGVRGRTGFEPGCASADTGPMANRVKRVKRKGLDGREGV